MYCIISSCSYQASPSWKSTKNKFGKSWKPTKKEILNPKLFETVTKNFYWTRSIYEMVRVSHSCHWLYKKTSQKLYRNKNNFNILLLKHAFYNFKGSKARFSIFQRMSFFQQKLQNSRLYDKLCLSVFNLLQPIKLTYY